MSDYSIALQRLIERFCRHDLSTFDRLEAPHHYDMLEKELDRIEELERENAERKTHWEYLRADLAAMIQRSQRAAVAEASSGEQGGE